MSDELITSFRAAGASEADLAAYVADKERQAAQAIVAADDFPLHPLNEPVLRSLGYVQSCFVFGFSGERCGFRWADANVLLDWHDIALDVRKRLPIAINAILMG